LNFHEAVYNAQNDTERTVMADARRTTFLNDNELEKGDVPKIVWVRVQDAAGLISPDNPKLHDIGGVVSSIEKYGLQELPKFDGTVGWIKAGNGRIEALAMMERDKKYKLPRGLVTEKDTGAWVMPVVAGVDAVDARQAKAYLLDSNNLTMSGGDFTPYDIAKMWDVNAYNNLLQGLASEGEFPVSMDEQDVATFDAVMRGLLFNLPEVSMEGGEARRTKITLVLELEETERLEEIVEAVRKFLDDSGYKVAVDV
jgi:hypothetical protein